MEPYLFPVVLLSVTRRQKRFVPAVEGDVEPMEVSELGSWRSSLCTDRNARKNTHQRAFLSGYHMVFSDALTPLQSDPIFRALTSA